MADYTDEQLAAGLDEMLASAKSQGLSEADTTKWITDTLFQNNISLQRLADATKYNEADIQNVLGRVSDQGAPITVPGDLGLTPTTGLKGTETALNAGLIQARKDVTGAATAAQGRIQDTTGQATSQLNPFKQTGYMANDKLAALNGLLGVDAQKQAFADFTNSPEQAYLVEQGNRNIIGNATAIGGLGGGNVRRELQRQGIGLAAQNFGNYTDRLQNTNAGGQNAAAGSAQLISNGGMAEGEILSNAGRQLADLGMSTAGNIGAARLSTAQLLGDQAFQSGLQDANFNQRNKELAYNGIGGAGADLASYIETAARNSGNVNVTTADILKSLASLGITTIPGLEGEASTIRGAGQLAGANQAAATGTTAAKALIGMI